MDYEVVMSNKAEVQLEKFIYYILVELGNEQAAVSVLDDAEAAKLRLSRTAGSLKLCDNPKLREAGYRVIHFEHHKYLMIYRLDGNIAYVEGIYHELQNYENKIC